MRQKIEIDENDWVVLITDLDEMDESPFSVVADNKQEAIDKAIIEWRAWLTEAEYTEDAASEEPRIGKIYRASWIGERVDDLDD